MKLLMLGPPGVGKGTIGRLLSQKLNLPHFSMGDVIRDHIIRGTEFGKIADSLISKGDLVPDDKVIKQMFLMTNRNKKYAKGMILDGFPRTLYQAKALRDKGFEIDKVVYLTARDEVLIKRLSSRRSCPKCKRVYNLVSQKPKKDETCDDDGTKLILRYDDKADVIKHRLDVYKERTQEIVNFFSDRLIEINGESTPQEVLNLTLAKLGK